MESFVGQTVSHYEFLEKLGSGGMGEIYKARDSRLNRIVAVKVLAPGRTRDPQRRRRFIQEAQAASALNHPNIVTIHDILPEGDTQYMVMEHVSGKTLHELIQAGRLPAPQALPIAMQMANALAAAHAAGIIHRDLKPANVMVTASGLVKVLDFGLAKLLDPTARLREADPNQAQDPATMSAAPLTAEGAIMGTVNYMSPEQAEGLRVDARSDIFSFGAVLYEMATGRRAFEGDSHVSTLSAVLRDEVKPIHDIAPDVPDDLERLIARCLRKNLDERWQSMSEVASALAKMTTRRDTAPRPARQSPATTVPAVAVVTKEGPKGKRSKGMWLGACAAGVLLLALAGAWWGWHRRNAPASPATAQPSTSASVPAPSIAPDAAPATTPQTTPQAGSDAANTISATAPPPPAAPTPFLRAKPDQIAPPPVVTATKPVATPQPAGVPATAPVATASAPHIAATPDVVAVTLSDGLPFRIALAEDVPLDAEIGRIVRFRAIDGLQGGPLPVIAKGAIVTGSIAALGGKRNFFGERSKVKFRLISAAAVDDSRIAVRATSKPGHNGVSTRAFATPEESARDLKEKNLIAAAGTEYVAYIAGDQTVNVRK